MSTKKRILFIANEMSPYIDGTSFADIVNKLAVLSNDNIWKLGASCQNLVLLMNAGTDYMKL